MASLAERRVATGRRAEAAVTRHLETAGFTVRNLNDLVGNCPFADLLARRDEARLLIQVKGTVTAEGKFTTPPARVRALEVISAELGCRAIYAFAHLVTDSPVIRFATAADVAALADTEEAT
jgi:hypothetical protein